jgi:LysR family hydrogen peroxide-inducible transcriptional activator
MELHQLRYFAAVAELRNFTRAAERCHVSQPSLSQQVIKLERELRAPLFERLGRTVQLTDAGHALYERAVRILGAVEEASASVRSDADWMSGEVSLGAIMTVAPYLLPDVVRGFLRQYPQARVTVREDFTAGIVRDCLTGELDVGLVALPIDDERLAVEPLLTEELLLALPARHPWRTRKRVVPADLADQSFVLLSELHCLGEQIVSYCRARDCRPAVTCQTAQLATVQEMVALGLGVSLVPEMAARTARSQRVAYRSLGKESPRRTIALIHHRDRYHSRLVQGLLDSLRQMGRVRGEGYKLRG